MRGPATMLPLLEEIRDAVSCHVAALPVPYRTHEHEPTFQSLRDPEALPGQMPFPTALDPFTIAVRGTHRSWIRQQQPSQELVRGLHAVRLEPGVIPLRLGIAVAVIGAVGPFVGSYEFVREERRRQATAA